MRSIETNICFETQIIKGKEDILKRIEDVIENASEKLDICTSHHILENSSHKNRLLNSCKQAYQRGVKIRYITKIKKENLLYVKQFLPVAKVRHLPNVVDVLVLNENEFLCNIGAISSYFNFATFLYSKTKEILIERITIFFTSIP